MEQKTILPSADRIYLKLLSLYPARYRKQYGEQMLYIFRDLYREEIEIYGGLHLSFWIQILTDVFISSSQQHMETIKREGPQVFIYKVMQYALFTIVTILFLLPALVDILFTIPQLFVLFNMDGSEAWSNTSLSSIFSTPYLFISGIIMSLILYIITLIHLVTSISHSQNRFIVFVDQIYKRFKPYIMVSNTLSLSTFAMFVPIIGAAIFDKSAILIKAFLITVITLVQYVKPNSILKTLGLLWFSVFSLFVGFMLYQIYIEFQPEYYGTFPLDDTKGIYKLNYDGDYWLTYYDVKKQCRTLQNKKHCDTILEKKGNTSITEAPGSLDRYLDKSIIVTGNFVKIYRQLEGEEKEFCITNGFSHRCHMSTGPGLWYNSPLKIKSIQIR